MPHVTCTKKVQDIKRDYYTDVFPVVLLVYVTCVSTPLAFGQVQQMSVVRECHTVTFYMFKYMLNRKIR